MGINARVGFVAIADCAELYRHKPTDRLFEVMPTRPDSKTILVREHGHSCFARRSRKSFMRNMKPVVLR